MNYHISIIMDSYNHCLSAYVFDNKHLPSTPVENDSGKMYLKNFTYKVSFQVVVEVNYDKTLKFHESWT